MIVSFAEQLLCKRLQDLPKEYAYRYTEDAACNLRHILFRSLTAHNDEILSTLFRGQVPKCPERWSLREAQGLTDDIEYGASARGQACGHIFKNGDSVYRCRTCTSDETCVLCARCFDASDHMGHLVVQTISMGNTGCCDCGDDEAWRIPVKCAIHTADPSQAAGKKPQTPKLPDELAECVRMTVGRAMDYLIDVISCSPENLRCEKTQQGILQDEESARLNSVWYKDLEDPMPEFALMLWNDEKHTVPEVEHQIARACKKPTIYGNLKASEINDTGRSVIEYSNNIPHLLKIATIIGQIRLTVTIRSSRDVFREQMCGTIIEWLTDIVGCAFGDDNEVLKHTICEELCRAWRTGSGASNKWIGKNGLDDHQIEEARAESSGIVVAPPERRRDIVGGRARGVPVENDSDETSNENENENEEDEDIENRANEGMLADDPMDVEMNQAVAQETTDRAPGVELEDETEMFEATYAGYPPPPPPPPHVATYEQRGPVDNDQDSVWRDGLSSMRANIPIPESPWRPRKGTQLETPSYWLERPEKSDSRENLPLFEDLSRRIRIDWLLLYDLRLWKQARIDLRDLLISSVVSVPQFKRILGLRFAGLYGVLAQLYLVADREFDHSIVNLSVQLFTVPSITQEIVERGNFITTLFSIVYTFLTKRTVKHPWEVGGDETLNFEHGGVTNRRMCHFFQDIKHLMCSDFIQSQLQSQGRYLLQFLDLVRLPQGICPNTRAVGEHVEYESDTWIAAQLLTKEINKLVRQFSEIFSPSNGASETELEHALRIWAKATVVNSLGVERMRFDQAELKSETRFHHLPVFLFESDGTEFDKQHKVVEFAVEKEPISFHHALHYTFSWLVDFGKAMPTEQLKAILHFDVDDLAPSPLSRYSKIPEHEPEDYLISLFDLPLRVCAWLAQMKAGLWVRNGISLRHQMQTYRGVSNRDLAHHRDIVLLQIALVVCDPSRILASMIDRFTMVDWMRGHFEVHEDFELTQQFDIAEDFIHLLIVLLSDRTSLQPTAPGEDSHIPAIRRDIIHILCFKPLSFSELNSRFADKAIDLEAYQEVLDEMTTYRPPEGIVDTGTFELKRENLAEVDPYAAHYTKNQRDEAENAYRTWVAETTGKPLSEIVFEPKLRPIESGLFRKLSSFTQTPLFAQVICYALASAFDHRMLEGLPMTRIESFLHVVLHLILIAVLEERPESFATFQIQDPSSFVQNTAKKRSVMGHTILEILVRILENAEFKSCHPKVRLILRRLKQRRPLVYDDAIRKIFADPTFAPLVSMESLGFETPRTPADEDEEAKQRLAKQMKKQQALDRQAKVMAQMQQQQQNFLNNAGLDEWDDEELEDAEVGDDHPIEEQAKLWKYPTGNCILCQEETNETRLYGTFALITNTTLFRKTNVRDPDYLNEVLSTPENLDRAADDIRPFGVASLNRSLITKLAADGQEFTTEHQGIGKGFPAGYSTRAPVSTGCGHIMHYSCFNTYCIATRRRQEHQIARNHPERSALKEYVCPLCKALGNAFLPMIWKGKEEAYPSVLESEKPFEEWISSVAGLNVSRFFKSEEGRAGEGRRLETFANYNSSTMIPSLPNALSAQNRTPLSSPISPPFSRRTQQAFPTLVLDSLPLLSPNRPVSPEFQPANELMSVFNLLKESMTANEIPSHYREDQASTSSFEDFKFTDSLATALGYSIAATEIAQRGVQAEEGKIFIHKIPSSVLTHLRILSETVTSYISVGVVSNSGRNASPHEFYTSAHRQIMQLFVGNAQIIGNVIDITTVENISAVLETDPFVFLTQCAVYSAPAANLDIHHLFRLCYLLEMVKVTLHLVSAQQHLEALASDPKVPRYDDVPTEHLEILHHFVTHISSVSNPSWPLMDYTIDSQSQGSFRKVANPWAPDMYRMLYRALSTYALSFLRKAAILFHVRCGVDFPDSSMQDVDNSELVRLTKLLQMPSLPELLFSASQTPGTGALGNGMVIDNVRGWIQHWQLSYGMPQMLGLSSPLIPSALTSLSPSHPAIFELVALPKYFDTLTFEVTRRRCPTKGGKMEDPAICLFCGAIFCSQALCCQKDGKLGGANQHMRE